MKQFKKLWALLLAAALVFTLAACNGGSEPVAGTGDAPAPAADSGDGAEEGGDAAPPAGDIDISDFVTVDLVVLGNKPSNGRGENALAEANVLIGERANAELTVRYVEWADWQTQYNLLLASGDPSLDLIMTATDWLYAWENTKKGSFLPLSEEMLQTYAPKTWAQIPAENWDLCRYNGDIYFIPEDQYTQYTNHGVMYRGDWAEEAGINPIEKFEDLEIYFQHIVDNYPDTVPWDIGAPNSLGGLSEGYVLSHTNYGVIQGTMTGQFALFFVSADDPYTVVSPYTEGDLYVEFAKLMQDWAEKGFWREDVLNYTGETRDLLYAGTSGIDQHHTQTYVTTVWNNMNIRQPGSDMKFYPFGYETKNVTNDLKTHQALAVSQNSQNPERALMVADIVRMDEDVYRLTNYGIEGVDYYVTDDGKLGRPEGFDKSVDNLELNFWFSRHDEYELQDVEWYDGMWDLYAEYETYARDYPLSKFIFEPDAVETEISNVANVCATNMTMIAYGKAGDPEAAVESFRTALDNAGFPAILEEIQRQLDEFKASEA